MTDIEKLFEERGILYGAMDSASLREKTGGGIAARHNGDTIVLVDETFPPRTKEFVQAHELGHVVLGHLDGSMDRNQRLSADMEADIFAIVLMALKTAGILDLKGRRNGME